MSEKKGFIPRADGNKKTWAANLKTNIAAQAPLVGLIAADVSSVQGSCTDIVNQIDTAEQAQQAAKAATANKVSHVSADEKNLRNYVRRIKANPGYTDTIGQVLGIIGDDHHVDEANSKPELKASKVPQGWQLDFNLHGHFDGINIYKRAAGAPDFSFLARDTASPYIDTAAAQPDTHYYAYYVIADTEVGQRSDEVVLGA
ncbi:MAG: hypothetical protein RJA07_829 [Bacteroidota bacterium]|jgi:hypothetical protein